MHLCLKAPMMILMCSQNEEQLPRRKLSSIFFLPVGERLIHLLRWPKSEDNCSSFLFWAALQGLQFDLTSFGSTVCYGQPCRMPPRGAQPLQEKSVVLVGYIQFKENIRSPIMIKLVFRSLSQVYVNLLILNSEEGKHTNKLYQI